MKPGVIGTSIVLGTGLILTIITIVKYSNRPNVMPEVVDGHIELRTVVQDQKYDELAAVETFKMTERSGSEFDSATLKGRVWVCSYFFTSCPSICLEQNKTIRKLTSEFSDKDVTWLSVTCDPAVDTTEILSKYATSFGADPNRWLFLTSNLPHITETARRNFLIPIGKGEHGSSLVVIDKWGIYRDRFDWQDPQELIRMKKVLRELLDEPAAPVGKTISTRAPTLSAFKEIRSPSVNPHAVGPTESKSEARPKVERAAQKEWITEFELIERNGQPFRSADMRGKVWVANFFFASCPSICTEFSKTIQGLQLGMPDKDVTFVSITVDPLQDTPSVLSTYAEKFKADKSKWLFVTSDEKKYIPRIASEFFSEGYLEPASHSANLVLVDKWGKVRGKFNFQTADDLTKLRVQIDKLLVETEPPPPEVKPAPVEKEDE